MSNKEIVQELLLRLPENATLQDIAREIASADTVRIGSDDGSQGQAPASFLQTARSLNLDGPPDWSAKLEEYLYGQRDRS